MATDIVLLKRHLFVGTDVPADGDKLVEDDSVHPLDSVYVVRGTGAVYVRKAVTKVAATDWVKTSGGGGGVESVTGDIVDNADPLNPVVNGLAVDGTVTGATTQPQEFTEGTTTIKTGDGTKFIGDSVAVTIPELIDESDMSVHYNSLVVSGDTGSTQSSNYRAENVFNSTADVGIMVAFNVYPTQTQAGATIDYFEAFSFDGFTNEATIQNLYGYYMGGIANGMSGSIDNFYGLYMENVSAGTTNNYAIYTNSGRIHFGGLADYADNAAALAGGLVAGDLFYTNNAGEATLKIVV